MPIAIRTIRAFAFAFCLTTLHAQSTPKAPTMTHATGTFEVKVLPTKNAPDPSIASYSINKTFHGDLEATSVGEMFSAGDPSTGNAGYIGIERVTGTLQGRTGTFAFMQMGIMSTGTAPQMTGNIVPGSGTGDLAGIHGTFTIIVAAGKHTYTIDYAIN